MKKILLFTFLIISASLFAQDSISSDIDKIAIPKFKNPKVQKVAKEYKAHMKDGIVFMKNSSADPARVEQWSKKNQSLAQKMAETFKLLANSPEEIKKWVDFATKISQYMVDAMPSSDKNDAESESEETETTEQPESK